jgi:DNA modification methylase
MGVEVIINANALFIPLASKSVHTIVTSPPYYGLRDYGTATWQGGDAECEHKGEPMRTKAYINGNTGTGNDVKNADSFQPYKNVCGKCGAIRIDEQIGLEVTPDAYIANLVDVFRECKRILRDDGTLWVNIGDSYASQPAGNKTPSGFSQTGGKREGKLSEYNTQVKGWGDAKQKDLIGIPWMLAFALRADGWYLRQDIIWAKPNPMPESVKDRCTKSHEYIFLLSKSAKYYYDNEAVKEPSKNPQDDLRRIKADKEKKYNVKAMQWNTKYKNLQPDGQQPNTMHLNRLEGEEYMSPVRNKRDVWTVTTKPYKGAHYATFNPELIKPCILAGAPEGGIVFDPFVGSGTTVATALQLGRQGVGLDLSMKYLRENAKERIDSVRLPLLECAL